MSNLHQDLMNEVYNKWQSDECRKMNRLEVIEKFFTNKHKAAVQLGNLNYQVNNGGFSQWDFNGYSEDLDDLIKLSKKGVLLGLKTFEPLLQILIDIKSLGEPDDYNDTEEHECFECGGRGTITEYDYDDENNEIETEVTCPECDGDGYYEEDIDGEEVYCDLISEFDEKYYDIGEDNLLKDFETFLEKFDSIQDTDANDMKFTTSNKPRCKLIGRDGNVFTIISVASNALKKAGLKDKAEEFRNKAINSDDYDDILILCMEYVEVY